MQIVETLILISAAAGTSLLYAALGEIFTERSGILNLGVEGTMLLSSLAAFAAVYYSGSLFLGVLTAMAVGLICSLIHGVLTISLGANQVLSGMGITLLGSSLAGFLSQTLGPESNGLALTGLQTLRFTPLSIPLLSSIPVAGALFRQDILTYLLFLLVPVAWYFLYKTRFGLNLRAVGENPRKAAALGLKVKSIQYIYTLLGGLLSGIAGAHLSLSFLPGWESNITGGRGWFIIALVFLAAWNPGRAVLGALLFGVIQAINAGRATSPSVFMEMLPYLTAIVILVLASARQRRGKYFLPPGSLGKSFIHKD